MSSDESDDADFEPKQNNRDDDDDDVNGNLYGFSTHFEIDSFQWK